MRLPQFGELGGSGETLFLGESKKFARVERESGAPETGPSLPPVVVAIVVAAVGGGVAEAE